ncbi:MAG: hypothetical protein A2087_13405 [Spirochaetes bacterium GWD1_61_31]|nr:MAG: hypothetical protein A2Y37_02810 [Spirochaetes bacterium GWB1_60_80]OHD39487.1 MAG: hypothetical protein A2087_13405 [Spirochaetes bacterium GWD1_61_31]OHD45539.1 MAG: hypothetical protein A2Y35_03080 [Spirochaetes bacterium GWE1_60_18]OHD58112.1 MAG: hypothetical protein A2Y32_05655 [Spirochaetes bacterium GWF1_60_12]HAP44684.1 hypothetical protein [Spirochaetaceae bacterium]
MKAACVIPAAGRSSRMGEWKPLLPWGRATIIETVIDAVLEAGCQALIVTGYRAAELEALLAGRPELHTIRNPDWEAGMLGSVRYGVRAAAALAEPGGAAGQGGCLILPADMPLLQPCVIKLLLERAAQETATGPDRPLSLFPTCGGTSGHPVWLDYCLLPAMDKLEPDSRLRDFLLTQPHAFLECGESGILLDLDTTDAYRAARPATPQH